MSDQKKTETSAIPDWLTSAAKDATTSAQAFYKTPYAPYTGARTAGVAPETTSALGMLKSYGADPGKAVAPYVNPYASASLDPAIARINEEQEQERQQIGAGAQFQGGYGDARHGIRENQLGGETQRRIGDLTAETMGKAYESGNDAFMKQLSAMFSAGSLTQQNQQAGLDANLAAYKEKQQDPYDRLAALVSSIGGVPYTKTSTSTQAANPWGILGSLLGAFIPG